MNLSILSIKKIQFFLLIAIFSFTLNGIAQNVSCTDTNAVNYNSNATTNDGSCLYDPIFINPENIIEKLPDVVNETSGLINFNGGLWTHNDSGGDAKIYKFSAETGEILQIIKIVNVKNHDIEDITQDEHYIYVGDFGNNFGNRKNLQVYKINKTNIPKSGDTIVTAEVISFNYKDQLSFERKNRRNNYDCEAFISLGNHLYLFSKNWANEITKCYRLPKQSGNYELEIIDTFDVRGLITAADFDSTKHRLVLAGYENFVPFMWTIWDFSKDQFFSGHKKRADFAYINGAQTEGICFKNPDEVYISCEASYYPQGLYHVNLNQIINTKESSEVFQKFQIEIFPNPDAKNIHMEIKGLSNDLFTLEIYNLRWEQINQFSFIEEAINGKIQIDIPIQKMDRGIYFVKIRQGKNRSFQKLILNRNDK